MEKREQLEKHSETAKLHTCKVKVICQQLEGWKKTELENICIS
jgi:hypothetical protein